MLLFLLSMFALWVVVIGVQMGHPLAGFVAIWALLTSVFEKKKLT